jgi:small subunit ribosomal protein S13
MPRIAGINIPDKKQIYIALTYIYGIGGSLSKKILKQADIDFFKKASELSEADILKIKKIIDEKFKIEGELRRELLKDVRRLKAIGCWRGTRHKKSLPVRGQKTRKNSRTVRGNVRKTVGSGKKGAPAPK